MRRLLSILVVLLFLAPVTALGADRVRHYLFAEISQGGDTLVDPDSGRSLDAGELIEVAYGASFLSEELYQWAIDFRAGVKGDYISLDGGGSAYFVRYPIELLVQRTVYKGLSLGLGATLHVFPSYRFKTDQVSDRVDFEEAFGGFLQAQYNWERFALGLRYLKIEYEKDGASFALPGKSELTDKIDGSSVGLYFNWYFN